MVRTEAPIGNGMLAMLRPRRLRYLIAPLLGAVTGLALCRGVLPLGLQAAGYGHFAAIGFYLSPLCWLSVTLMALGGLGVARAKHTLEALKAFSLSGLLAGAGLAAFGLDTTPRLLAMAGLLGWLYGLPGGALLQAVLSGLPQPVDPEADASDAGASGEADGGGPVAGDSGARGDSGTPGDYSI